MLASAKKCFHSWRILEKTRYQRLGFKHIIKINAYIYIYMYNTNATFNVQMYLYSFITKNDTSFTILIAIYFAPFQKE
jgi:hypothetical protein